MKTLYLESIAGIAGDMFAASFVDAGLVSLKELQTLSQNLNIPEVEIKTSEVIRSNMRATHIDVIFNKADWLKQFPYVHHHKLSANEADEILQKDFHVHFLELERIILHSALSENTKTLACKILDSLAEAEAHCHGVSKNEVAFHELGMVDSLMDIVMAAYCISTVGADFIMASPVKLGRGLITTSHGTLPVPPPVSAALAIGMPVSTIPPSIQQDHIELSTPTGLAILKSLKPHFLPNWPNGIILAQGSGAGTMDLENYPNLFRISLLETIETTHALPYEYDTIIEVMANYDDASPEYLAWATEKLFEYGALDVWQAAVVGKKGRVMIVVSVLVERPQWIACVDFMLKKTSTFGLRYKSMERLKLKRHFETRTTDKGSFQVKIGCDLQGKKLKEKFEFEDIRQAWDKDQ